MTILIHLDRSEAVAESHGGEPGRTTIEYQYDTDEGPWVQLTYGSIRTQDGDFLIEQDEDGCWLYGDGAFSDVVIEFVHPVALRPEISPRELATVLAALRYWQQDLADNPEGPINSEHFDEHTPLDVDEIDELCQRLNLTPPVIIGSHDEGGDDGKCDSCGHELLWDANERIYFCPNTWEHG